MPEEASGASEPANVESGRRIRRPEIRVGAVIAIAIAVAVVVWVAVGRGGSSDEHAAATSTAASDRLGPVAQSQQAIAALSKSLGEPIYWMGPKSGYTYELLRTSDGRAYVRYLPSGVKPGDPRADFTLVATYPFKNSYDALKAVSGSNAINLPGGGIAAVAPHYPKSVRLSFPGVDYQIEVYDPSPARSLQIALSGDVQPVS